MWKLKPFLSKRYFRRFRASLYLSLSAIPRVARFPPSIMQFRPAFFFLFVVFCFSMHHTTPSLFAFPCSSPVGPFSAGTNTRTELFCVPVCQSPIVPRRRTDSRWLVFIPSRISLPLFFCFPPLNIAARFRRTLLCFLPRAILAAFAVLWAGPFPSPRSSGADN